MEGVGQPHQDGSIAAASMPNQAAARNVPREGDFQRLEASSAEIGKSAKSMRQAIDAQEEFDDDFQAKVHPPHPPTWQTSPPATTTQTTLTLHMAT